MQPEYLPAYPPLARSMAGTPLDAGRRAGSLIRMLPLRLSGAADAIDSHMSGGHSRRGTTAILPAIVGSPESVPHRHRRPTSNRVWVPGLRYCQVSLERARGTSPARRGTKVRNNPGMMPCHLEED